MTVYPSGPIIQPQTQESGLIDEKQETRSFEDFFSSEYERLARSMWLLTGNRTDGEDLAQEAMVRALERWDRVRMTLDPVAYVYRIAFNLNHRLTRRLMRQRRLEPGFAASIPPSVESVEVMREMSLLPTRDREILVAMTWLGLSSQEAATILGIKPSAARVRLHRARERLGRAIDPIQSKGE